MTMGTIVMDVRHNRMIMDVRLFNAVALKRHQDDDEKKNPYRMVWVLSSTSGLPRRT